MHCVDFVCSGSPSWALWPREWTTPQLSLIPCLVLFSYICHSWLLPSFSPCCLPSLFLHFQWSLSLRAGTSFTSLCFQWLEYHLSQSRCSEYLCYMGKWMNELKLTQFDSSENENFVILRKEDIVIFFKTFNHIAGTVLEIARNIIQQNFMVWDEAVLMFLSKWKCRSLRDMWFFATPWTVACQAPLSMGISRQEGWSG